MPIPSPDVTILPFFYLLAFLWFLFYWLSGGVLFALITLIKLGRVRKVRFSVLFTGWSLICGIASAWIGLIVAGESVKTCLETAYNKAEQMMALFGCGFAGVLGTFLFGAAAVVLGGWIILSISKTKHRPWINLDTQKDIPDPQTKESQFF